MQKLENKKIAILAADGFEQVELEKPRQALEKAGAITKIVSPTPKKIQGMNHDVKGETIPVDIPLDQAKPGRLRCPHDPRRPHESR